MLHPTSAETAGRPHVQPTQEVTKAGSLIVVGENRSHRANQEVLFAPSADRCRITGNPEVMPRMDSQRRWPEVGLEEE